MQNSDHAGNLANKCHIVLYCEHGHALPIELKRGGSFVNWPAARGWGTLKEGTLSAVARGRRWRRMSDEDDVRNLIDRTVDCFSRLDAVASNAGTEGRLAPVTR